MTAQKTRRQTTSETLAETLQGQGARPVTVRRRRLAGLTAVVLALSVVLASAVQVRADNDTRDLLAALAALAVIGAILNEADNDRNDPPAVRPVPPRHAPQPHRPYRPKPLFGARIPTACATIIERGERRGTILYAEECLHRHGLDRLPDRCARKVRRHGRSEWYYGETCLREAGYLIDRDNHFDFGRD